jgi:Protein of unknown function (DUF 659)/hAT family C-terminal dimerisation region
MSITPENGYVDRYGPNNWHCQYCDKDYTGTATRVRGHLGHLKGKGIGPCKYVPNEVKEEMQNLESTYSSNSIKKQTLNRLDRVTQDTLDDGAGPSENYEEVQHPSETQEVLESIAEESSGFPPSKKLKQQKITDALKRQDKTGLDKLWARAFYSGGISFNFANNPYFQEAVSQTALNNGVYKNPRRKALAGDMLIQERRLVEKDLDVYKGGLKDTGCTLSSDGWSDITSKPLINLIVNTPKGEMFLEAVNTSGEYKDAKYIANCIIKGIDKVGVNDVVQVITDSAPVCRAATEIVHHKYPKIFASPCATHVLDLLLKDFGNLPWVCRIVKECFEVVKFITNHQRTLHQFKELSKLNLKKPAPTRFASNFHMMDRVVKVKQELQTLVVSKEWNTWIGSREVTGTLREHGTIIKDTILFDGFWNSLRQVIGLSERVVKILRATDSGVPYMGEIWANMSQVSQDLDNLVVGNLKGFERVYISEERIQELKRLVDERWKMLSTPLHCAGYLLNPRYWDSSNEREKDDEVKEGWTKVLEAYCGEDYEQAVIIRRELNNFRNKEGVYAREVAKLAAKSWPGWKWWQEFGVSSGSIRKLAIRVLSQVTSASACERNWSSYDFIHSKKRNRLRTERAQDLVFVFSNLRLNRNLRRISYKEKGEDWTNDDDDEGDSEEIEEEEDEIDD